MTTKGGAQSPMALASRRAYGAVPRGPPSRGESPHTGPCDEPSAAAAPGWSWASALGVGLGSALVLLASALAFVSAGAHGTAPSLVASTGTFDEGSDGLSSFASSESGELRLRCSNSYTKTEGYVGQGYPWLSEGHLVEPHRESTLKLWEAPGKPHDAFYWHIEQQTNTKVSGKFEVYNTTTDADLAVTFTAPGNYKVTVTSTSGAGSKTESTMIACRYVRRSIRALSDDDRNAFFDAFLLMMQTSSTDGEARFGEDYRSLKSFVALHAELAGNKLSDHMHDGLGFLTQHAALTMAFESALQAVEPSLAVPYWDFTYDIKEADNYDDVQVAIWSMDLWQPSWFGNATGAEHTVQEGRWAFQQIDTADANSTVFSPYGYLRAPWNVNKSPYLTRVHNFCGYPLLLQKNWPTCQMHREWVTGSDYHELYDYLWHAPYAPHATVHSSIGGYTNCGNVTAEFAAAGVTIPDHDLSLAVGKMVTDAIIFVKSMYRAGYAESPGFCSSDTPQEECHMMCSSQVNNRSFVMDLVSEHPKWVGTWIEDVPEKFWPEVARVLCTTPWSPGEHIEAASPADVSFWPVHPTLERLTQYKRLHMDFKSLRWDNPDGTTKICIYGDAGCKGHHAVDLTSFEVSHANADEEFVKEYLSNIELFEIMNPNHYHLNFIYDNFKWDHCSGKYSFPELSWGNSTTLSAKDTPVAKTAPSS